MTDAFVETPAEPTTDRLQIIAAIILGIAATLTALAAYKAALTDGDALQGYTQSTRLLTDANAFYAQGNQTSAGDQQLFVAYATASQEGNAELAAYLTTLMRPELQEAVEWWQGSEEAETPFDEADDNPYTVADYDEAQSLEEQAEVAFNEGAEADELGDKFELSAVLLALVLFFGGVATLFASRKVSGALLAVATVVLLAGGGMLASAFGG